MNPADDESRLYWLSFVDDRRPFGDQFLGVSIVRVTGADVRAVLPILAAKFPRHDTVDGPWIAAATRKAHQLGINPGGQVGSIRLDDVPGVPAYPENVMLTTAQIRQFGSPKKTP
jgi:hypothetical protein